MKTFYDDLIERGCEVLLIDTYRMKSDDKEYIHKNYLFRSTGQLPHEILRISKGDNFFYIDATFSRYEKEILERLNEWEVGNGKAI